MFPIKIQKHYVKDMFPMKRQNTMFPSTKKKNIDLKEFTY